MWTWLVGIRPLLQPNTSTPFIISAPISYLHHLYLHLSSASDSSSIISSSLLRYIFPVISSVVRFLLVLPFYGLIQPHPLIYIHLLHHAFENLDSLRAERRYFGRPNPPLLGHSCTTPSRHDNTCRLLQAFGIKNSKLKEHVIRTRMRFHQSLHASCL